MHSQRPEGQARCLSLRLWERSHALTHGKDKYGRTIADVLLPDGTNVNHALIKDGWCWWYRRYTPGNGELETLEAEAKSKPHPTVGVGERVAAEEKELTGLLRGWVREWGSYFMLESDLMAWQVGRPCTFPHSDATRHERNF